MQFRSHLRIIEHLLHCCLGVVKITGNANHIGVIAFLCYHLLLLDRADAVFGIEYDDPGTRNISKTCHRRLTCISGSCCKDHDLIFDIIFLRRRSHQVREDGKSHVFKGDRRSVEQLQKINSVSCLVKRRDLLCIEFGIICSGNTVFKLFFRIICKKAAHNFIRCFLVCHLCKTAQRNIQFRDTHRHEQAAVLRKPLQYCLGGRYRFTVSSCTFI